MKTLGWDYPMSWGDVWSFFFRRVLTKMELMQSLKSIGFANISWWSAGCILSAKLQVAGCGECGEKKHTTHSFDAGVKTFNQPTHPPGLWKRWWIQRGFWIPTRSWLSSHLDPMGNLPTFLRVERCTSWCSYIHRSLYCTIYIIYNMYPHHIRRNCCKSELCNEVNWKTVKKTTWKKTKDLENPEQNPASCRFWWNPWSTVQSCVLCGLGQQCLASTLRGVCHKGFFSWHIGMLKSSNKVSFVWIVFFPQMLWQALASVGWTSYIWSNIFFRHMRC